MRFNARIAEEIFLHILSISVYRRKILLQMFNASFLNSGLCQKNIIELRLEFNAHAAAAQDWAARNLAGSA